jgi:hypothetical protein
VAFVINVRSLFVCFVPSLAAGLMIVMRIVANALSLKGVSDATLRNFKTNLW